MRVVLKRLILLLLIVGAAVTTARAQIKVEQVQIDGDEPLSKDDLMGRYEYLLPIKNFIQLNKDANHVAIINMRGDRNAASITQQSGSGNIGAIHILGNGNKSNLIQNGSELLSLIYIHGVANRLDLDQSGTELGNIIQVNGSSLIITVMQNNTGFKFIQTGSTIPTMISSSSPHVPIIIKNN